MDFTSSRPEDLFFAAARRGDVTALQALLAEGVDVNTQDGKGFTALILAAYDDHLDATRLLLEAGAALLAASRGTRKPRTKPRAAAHSHGYQEP